MKLFKDKLCTLLAKQSGVLKKEVMLERPIDTQLGDFAFPCFVLAKKQKKNPVVIAKELKQRIEKQEPDFLKEVRADGPYLNFFIDNCVLAKNVLETIEQEKKKYGLHKKNKKHIVIEYPSPNTNKPLHLGHLRNMLLGKSISSLLEHAGSRVTQVNLNNDRGIHICKAMLAYKKYGRGKKPNKKKDHFVGDYYVMYSNKVKKHPELAEEAQEMLRKWEQGDTKVLQLWKKMNSWALQGFKETYRKFNITFDKEYTESSIYEEGKRLVKEAYRKKLLEKDKKRNIMIRLEPYGLPDKILLRADGTSIYMTQDVYLAKKKYEDFKMDSSIIVVGSEQNLHFKQLFKITELLKIKTGKQVHFSYGMISLPHGKMKSREGTVVDADDLLEKMISLAKKEIQKRHKTLSEQETEKRARIIGKGALVFFILKYDPQRNFVFDPKESISFEGETGPYVQYAHARACSVLRKAKEKKIKVRKTDCTLLNHDVEKKVLMLLAEFPEVIQEAAMHYKPSIVARYLIDLAQTFTSFYHACPFISENEPVMRERLRLVNATKQVLATGLGLLNITAPEQM